MDQSRFPEPRSANDVQRLSIPARGSSQQPPERVAEGLPFVDAGGRLNVGDIYNQVAFWQTQGRVDKSVDAKAILDLSLVQGHFNLPH